MFSWSFLFWAVLVGEFLVQSVDRLFWGCFGFCEFLRSHRLVWACFFVSMTYGQLHLEHLTVAEPQAAHFETVRSFLLPHFGHLSFVIRLCSLFFGATTILGIFP